MEPSGKRHKSSHETSSVDTSLNDTITVSRSESTLSQSVPQPAEAQQNTISCAQSEKAEAMLRPSPRKKRGRYVSSACMRCQMKRVRCTGEDVCQHCQATDNECVYAADRRRALRPTTAASISRKALPDRTYRNNIVGDSEAMLRALSEFANRIEALEQQRTKQSADAVDSNNERSYAEYDGDSGIGGMDSNGQSELSEIPHEEIVRATTAQSQVISVTDQSCAAVNSNHNTPSEQSATATSTTIGVMNFPRLGRTNLRTLIRESRSFKAEILQETINTFFTVVHPSWPCLNENMFRDQLKSFLTAADEQKPAVETQQFAAQLNLIFAIVQCLHEDSYASIHVPGWEEFCRAEDIIYRLVWLGNGNFMTLQCLIMKAMYHLYSGNSDAAYDTMGRAVRLCFQLGLHSKRATAKCTEFDAAMRQRLFYIIYYLEHHIAFNCGAPHLIHDADYDIEYPRALDDAAMFADKPLPDEVPECSVASWVVCSAKWAKLLSEIWFKMFAINAQEKYNLEYIALTDARILYIASTFPKHLQCLDEHYTFEHDDQYSLNVRRHRLLLFLRHNQFRLLIRQDIILSPHYNDTLGDQCLSISSSTVEAVIAYMASPDWQVIDCFLCILYMVGALLVLVRLIIKREISNSTRERAIVSFTKGLNVLTSMSSSSKRARQALQKLNSIIDNVHRAIARFRAGDDLFVGTLDFDQNYSTMSFTHPLGGISMMDDINGDDIDMLLNQMPDVSLSFDEHGGTSDFGFLNNGTPAFFGVID